jgi:2,3-dihydroxybenzoate decarboxylase
MGETLPYVLWRLDSRAALNTKNRPLKLPPSAYLKRNLYVTTSGQCDDVPLIAALSALGEDHVLFSIDYPYEDSQPRGVLSSTRRSATSSARKSAAVMRAPSCL